MCNYLSRLYKDIIGTKDNRSFFSKLLLSFLITAITSTLLLTAFLTTTSLHQITSSVKNYNQQLLSQTNYAIDQMEENVDRLAATLINNNHVKAYLTSKETNNQTPVLASRILAENSLVLPYVESIYLFNASADLVYSSRTGYQQPIANFEDPEVINRLKNPDFYKSYHGQPIPSHKNSKTNSYDVLSYYIIDNSKTSGMRKNTIVINVYASSLTDSIASMQNLTSSTDSSFLLLDKDNALLTGVLDSEITRSDAWLQSALQKLSSEKIPEHAFVTVYGKPYLLTGTDKNTYGWHLLNYTPARVIFSSLLPTTLISFFLLICVLLFTCVVCQRFARRLNEPIETLTQLLKEKHSLPQKHDLSDIQEFQTIMSSISLLQENNRELRTVQQKTRYSLMQSLLNDLVLNHHVDSPELVQQKLHHLELEYLTKDKLYMIVFKIDNYKNFLQTYTSDELWVIRFSVVNIIEELASALSVCTAFSQDNDKFVLLLSCESIKDMVNFEDQLVLLIQSIQQNIETYLQFTVTAAYSPVFQSLDRLPEVYKNMENSLRLKLRHGHHAIIDPYQIDEVQTEAFQPSYKATSLLIERLGVGQFDEAWDAYETLTQDLFLCEYSNVMATMIHLAHSIYERLPERFPMLKDSLTEYLKTFVSGLEAVEISDDIQELARTFFKSICSAVQKLRADPDQQSTALIAQKIKQIIEDGFPNPSLCLTSIAEEVGLSANYTGHIFKQYNQKSVSQYILELRMEKIANYLQTTSLPLSKILEKVGMEKNNYFYTRFKNYFGMPLGEYRKQFRADAADEDE